MAIRSLNPPTMFSRAKRPIVLESHAEDAAALRASAYDLSRFEPVYDHYFDRIFAYCLRRVASAPNPVAEAEDLASLVFARAMTHAGEFRGGSVAAWLFRIAHNTVIDHYRQRADVQTLDTVDEDREPSDGGDLWQTIDLRADLQDVISALTDDEQNLLWLRVIAGLNASEIADVLGRRAGAVRMELHRLIHALRSRYGHLFEDSAEDSRDE